MCAPRCCNPQQHTATHCNTLQHTATHCSTLQYIATHCNPLQPTATHCSTLQPTAPDSKTSTPLQPSAIHCNVMQPTATCLPIHSRQVALKSAQYIYLRIAANSQRTATRCIIMRICPFITAKLLLNLCNTSTYVLPPIRNALQHVAS